MFYEESEDLDIGFEDMFKKKHIYRDEDLEVCNRYSAERRHINSISSCYSILDSVKRDV